MGVQGEGGGYGKLETLTWLNIKIRTHNYSKNKNLSDFLQHYAKWSMFPAGSPANHLQKWKTLELFFEQRCFLGVAVAAVR